MRRRQVQPRRGHSSRRGALEILQAAKSMARAEMKRAVEDERDGQVARLRNPQYCSKYLSAAFRDSAGTFLMGAAQCRGAQKGMSKLAAEAGVNRENLYRMLSERGSRAARAIRPRGVKTRTSGKPALREWVGQAAVMYSAIVLGSGIGSPSSRMPARCIRMAPRISSAVSSFVAPAATHPGRSGTYAL